MNIPTSEPIPPEEDEQIAPANRRRQRRPPESEKIEGPRNLRTLLHLTAPSFDYYIGFLLAGIIAAAAMLLDAPAFYLLAVLFAPFLGPVYGLPLAAAAGSGMVFLRSFFHLTIGGGLVFALGALAGWLGSNLHSEGSFNLVQLYTRQSWPDFLVVAVGSGLTAYLLARSPRQKPLVANIAVAYGLVLPLAASGFVFIAGSSPDWEFGVGVFISRLALAVLVSAVVFALLGYKPVSLPGYTLSVMILLASIGAFVVTAGTNPTPTPKPQPPAQPITVSSPTASSTAAASPVLFATPQPEAISTPSVQVTSTPTETLVASLTQTATITLVPTPVWAKIDAPSGGGAFIRAEPGGKILTSLLNGSPVEVISEPLRVDGGAIWVKVRTENGVEGWILQSLLATATPSPGW